MNKKLKEKNGSTMLLLIVAIAIISVLGTSILGVTMMNYKIKKANTDIKQSFYLSESGLDNAYSNAYKLVVQAVEDGNTAAKNFVDQFTLEKLSDWEGSVYTDFKADEEGNKTYYYKEDVIQDEAEEKFKNAYRNTIKNTSDGIVKKIEDASYDKPAEKKKLAVKVINAPGLDFSGGKMSIDIESSYTSAKDITKTTKVTMEIGEANYNEVYSAETKNIPVNPFWLKAVAAGDMEVSGNTEFDGNIYVSGDMTITGGVESKFKNNLVVKNDIVLKGSNSSAVVKDVYARNILMEGASAKFKTEGAGNNIYILDDLEFDNSNQEVYIDGSYYGFSDGRSSTTPDNSSGININISNGIKLTITDKLYLFGTSYVSVSPSIKYQTGESISVKGNYRAYLQPLTLVGARTSDNKDLTSVEFKDYEYLRLADKFIGGRELTAMDKADYIKFYRDEYGVDSGLSVPSGININFSNTYALGSTIDGGVLKAATFDFVDIGVFNDIRDNKYPKQTKSLGYEDIPEITFGNQVKLSNLGSSIINTSDKFNYVYINKDGGALDLPSGEYKGLIITNGKVNINGGVKFTGAIVCGDKITFTGSGNTVKYDKNIAARIINKYDLGKSVFKDSVSVETLKMTEFSGGSEIGAVNFNNLLRLRSWKIK